MIGNDLESLSNWPVRSDKRRLRFRRKVYTEIERHWLCNQLDADYAEVVLWCAKEAVYKASHRYTGERKFCPKDLEILPNEQASLGEGEFQSQIEKSSFKGQWWTEEDLVHAITWEESIARETLSYSINEEGGNPSCLDRHFKDEQYRPWLSRNGRMLPLSRSKSGGVIAELVLQYAECGKQTIR